MSDKLTYGLAKIISSPRIQKQLVEAGKAVVAAAAPVVVSTLPVLVPVAVVAAGTVGAFALGNAVSKNKNE